MRKRFIWDKEKKELVSEEQFIKPLKESFQFIKDIQPYQSMIDGSIISSRSKHRLHLKQHGCVEVGNDSSLHKPRKPLESPPGLKETLIQVANEKLR